MAWRIGWTDPLVSGVQAGLPLEGMNLYNNGFSGGLVAIVLYPILQTVVKNRRPVLMEEDLFAMFEEMRSQSPEELPPKERRSGKDRRFERAA